MLVLSQREAREGHHRAPLPRYLNGKLKTKSKNSFYQEGHLNELTTFVFEALDGKVQVWQSAFDLRRFGRQGAAALAALRAEVQPLSASKRSSFF